jgi:hypothetical protein
MDFLSVFDSAPNSNGNRKPPSGLDAFDTATPFRPLQPGVYTARVVSGQYTQTKTKGEDCYRIVFQVTEGPHRGERVARVWTFGDRAVRYAKRDLAAFGLATAKQLLEPFPPIGREICCKLVVALQRGDDGSEFNDVKRVEVLRAEDSAAKPYLIDPDAPGDEGGPS